MTDEAFHWLTVDFPLARGIKAYISYPLPGESVVHKDKDKEVRKMKMNKRKLEDVPVSFIDEIWMEK